MILGKMVKILKTDTSTVMKEQKYQSIGILMLLTLT